MLHISKYIIGNISKFSAITLALAFMEGFYSVSVK